LIRTYYGPGAYYFTYAAYAFITRRDAMVLLRRRDAAADAYAIVSPLPLIFCHFPLPPLLMFSAYAITLADMMRAKDVESTPFTPLSLILSSPFCFAIRCRRLEIPFSRRRADACRCR